jgi:mono/diheme cytochrome c family protein
MNYRWLLVPVVISGLGISTYGQDKPQIQKAPLKSTSAASGTEMFSAYCAVCHGPSGRGNGPAAAALKKQPADLTQLSKKNGGKFPGNSVVQVIKGDEILASHGSRDMPVWGKLFRETEGDRLASMRISNLTKYVESLQEK